MLQISVPTLVIDSERVQRNISRMNNKAIEAGVDFRPHFKTHQSSAIGELFKGHGVSKIAVSSIRMAAYFASSGWQDILVAIPLNLNETTEINLLASRIRLGLTVECDITVAMLHRELKEPVDMYIELDTGYHRTGVRWDDFNFIDRIIQRIEASDLMTFRGFILHAGETYQVSGQNRSEKKAAILAILQSSLEKLQKVKERYHPEYPDLVISYGDTPSCTLGSTFGAVTEIRPGNFVFYDLTMYSLGVCDYGDIAVALACPVIGLNHSRKEVAVYGGAVHFSKEGLLADQGMTFGQLVQSSSIGWGHAVEGARLIRLSQEHGIAHFEHETVFRRIGIGDLLWFLPVHSCLTADLMGQYLALDGKTISCLSNRYCPE